MRLRRLMRYPAEQGREAAATGAVRPPRLRRGVQAAAVTLPPINRRLDNSQQKARAITLPSNAAPSCEDVVKDQLTHIPMLVGTAPRMENPAAKRIKRPRLGAGRACGIARAAIIAPNGPTNDDRKRQRPLILSGCIDGFSSVASFGLENLRRCLVARLQQRSGSSFASL
jgi:hypothetical protein